MSVAVLGGGSWGTALADLLASKGVEVVLWAYEPEVAEEINRRHRNDLFLPEAPLAPSLRATNDMREALRGADVVLAVPPSHVARAVLREAARHASSGVLVISASKGLEPETLKRMSEVALEELRGAAVVALSGPTFAREVYQRQPTACVAASSDAAAAKRAQQLLSAPHFRVYTNDDVIGVELAGALKNVIAIAAGILEGLGIGHNTRAALITRGLAEMTRLGVALGANPLTYAGLAGMGDLVLTATGPLSRNRSLGVELGKGATLADIQARRLSVAEGVGTARTAVALGERVGVELPISREVGRVLFENKPPRQAIAELMERTLTSERGESQ
ncbi:MAG TPA: NAD(P)H-dependent glycerol-3-phosphate dehydrogenase [Gemmatimonadales bacterium]|nr:NAD(P)H-dependent glycerol-3-phosphate dehydrogenase [Gemmatimonadales bacterium]